MKIRTISIIMALLLITCTALSGCSSGASPSSSADTSTPSDSGEEVPVTDIGGYPEMTIIFAHSAATTDARHQGALAVKEYIETNSGGSITVDVYPSGQLGDSRSIIESVQNGGIHICIQPPANVSGFDPLMAVTDVPYFMPDDLEQARAIIAGPAGQALLETMEDYSMVGLDFWVDLYKAFTANKPLRTTEDFRGMKFRVMSSPVLIKMIEALGGSAQTIDYSETFSALQTGAIDGQEAGVGAGIYNMKFYEVQDYMMLTNHILALQLVFGNKAWFDSLDDNTRQLVLEGIKAGEEAHKKARLENEDEALEEIGKTTEILTLTPEELQGLSDASRQPCIDLFLETNGDAGKAIVDVFDQEIAKLS